MKRNKVNQAEVRKNAVIYLRCSTTEQSMSGLGLADQEAKCRAYCILNNLPVQGVYVDSGISGSTITGRPALNAAIEALQPGSTLIFLNLARLTRNRQDLEPLTTRIESAGATWLSITECYNIATASGRLHLRIALEMNQYERELIGERTSAALQQLKIQGKRLGCSPLGYSTLANGDVVENAEEMAIVNRARLLRESKMSYRAIADQLTLEGHSTKHGKRWEAMTVLRLVKTRYLETI